MKYIHLSKGSLHAIPDKELREDRGRLEEEEKEPMFQVKQKIKQAELKIINAEKARRPIMVEDVFK